MTDFSIMRRAMVDTQVRPSAVTRLDLIDAMLELPRERFVPPQRRDIAYAETDVPVAPGRALLAPRTLAKMLEAAAIERNHLVLELAPATGYSTALIARMAEAVVAVEPEDELRRTAQGLLDEIEVMNAAIAGGSPQEGDPAHGPYDVIFINGMIEVLPEALTAQLKTGGRLVTLVDVGGVGKCRVITRGAGGLSERTAFDATGPVLEGFRRRPQFTF